MAEVKDCWQANLTILGKLEPGDMLAVAGNDGKLVRKTNWLTQAANKSKTHDHDLFEQIKSVLDSAVTKMEEDDYEVNKVLIKQYDKAHKGLEILLSTYKSKGSKETYLIDRLTPVLAHHMKIFETRNNGSSEKQELKKYAEQAIQFVNDCRIRSVNNVMRGGWGNSYFGEKYDEILFALMVRCASKTKIGDKDKNTYAVFTPKDLKKILVEIIRKPCSRKDKKVLLGNELNKLMEVNAISKLEYNKRIDWLLDEDFITRDRMDLNHIPMKTNEEEVRIKLAKRTIKYRLGNCLDKACVAATHLIENTRNEIGIVMVNGGALYDHAWVLISTKKDALLDAALKCYYRKEGDANYKINFPEDTWVVDGWTRDWWQLRAWTNSVCNPRQYVVRNKIRNVIKRGPIAAPFGPEPAFNMPSIPISISWPPQSGFRLRFAHMTKLDWGKLGDTIKVRMNEREFSEGLLNLRHVTNELRTLDIFPSKVLDAIAGNSGSGVVYDILLDSGANRRSHNSNSLRDSGSSFSSSRDSVFSGYY